MFSHRFNIQRIADAFDGRTTRLLEIFLEVDVGLMDRFWALAKIPLGPGKSKSGQACMGL